MTLPSTRRVRLHLTKLAHGDGYNETKTTVWVGLTPPTTHVLLTVLTHTTMMVLILFLCFSMLAGVCSAENLRPIIGEEICLLTVVWIT